MRGGECKVWAQKVINDAVGVWVPTNSSETTHLWEDDTTGRVIKITSNIALAIPGDVVQMVIRARGGGHTPHTAIVGSNLSSSIVWLESNYGGDGLVTTDRTQTHTNFLDSVIKNQFSIYRIR